MSQVITPGRLKEQPTVAKRKKDSPALGAKQVNFRPSDSLYARLERVSKILEVDMSNLVRLILNENLAAYERRADEIDRHRQEREKPE